MTNERKEYNREYQKNNADKLKEYRKEYRKKNADKIKVYHKNRYNLLKNGKKN